MNVKTGILLSVREKATRLPGKVLKPLGENDTVTEFLLERLKKSANADKVILSTSVDKRDAVLCEIAQRCSLDCYRGSEDDKLLRYRDTAREYGLDFVVIVDGDDPFISVEHIDKIIEYAKSHDDDYVIYDGLPLGATGFGLRTSALETICEGRTESDTEVWGNMFLNNSAYKCTKLKEESALYNKPHVRMTLDYPEDYLFFTTIVDALQNQNRDVTFNNIMKYISSNENVSEINKGVQEAYESHLAGTCQS